MDIITSFSRTAEPGLDYSVTSLPVVFPVGSAMGNGECANISISADGLVEADESFSITASISSLDGYQPSDTAEVIIRDDDGNDVNCSCSNAYMSHLKMIVK